jgi:hypothetical protein
MQSAETLVMAYFPSCADFVLCAGILNSQFSILNSQFSILNSQFSILHQPNVRQIVMSKKPSCRLQ